MSRIGRFTPHPPAPIGRGEVVLSAADVSVTLGGKRIIAEVGFQVRCGEVLAIIGPNGAGKSTLLGALAGDHPYGGAITLDGREVTAWPNRELALRRAVLRQNNSVSFPFSVVDIVKMGRAPWRSITPVEEDDRIIAEEMLRSDTFRFAERSYTSLSGGERARVSLARAMTQRTGLLLLDEPTAALDINYQEQVLAVARRTARQGNAVVVVLHDLAAAAAYSDRVLMLADGTMRAWGTPEEVLTEELVSEVYRHPVRVGRDADGALAITPIRFPDEDPAATGTHAHPERTPK
ncbi:heme ABC transporter ATP-binding protein [Leucobacter luti]|uniref:Iron complex transport system ATP-binding protein n=1 Tax=Leucobacter luti TaxID=340320 RepID=A0A4Q7TWT3_9MICO|nr:heme ABC transporter ATP-binding protein [Leucobacter luti]RZT64630.1 iron complex transport system ATP-binding protein [Leucobacter luti]